MNGVRQVYAAEPQAAEASWIGSHAFSERCIMAHCLLRASPEPAQEGLVDVLFSVGLRQKVARRWGRTG